LKLEFEAINELIFWRDNLKDLNKRQFTPYKILQPLLLSTCSVKTNLLRNYCISLSRNESLENKLGYLSVEHSELENN